MATRLGISAADLRRLAAVTDRSQIGSDDRSVPHSVLGALHDLVPCDQITYQVMDPSRREWIDCLDLFSIDIDDPSDDYYWPAFWSSEVCSYPQRTGDRRTVTLSSDFVTSADFSRTEIGELFRSQEMRFNAVVPLAADGTIDHRIELWRSTGPDFTERERMLLTLLRPHLCEFEQAARESAAAPPLTPRQLELLGHVAEGMTNRQIARRAEISEGTVRRHLENIFERLGITSRAAAAAYYVRLSLPTAP